MQGAAAKVSSSRQRFCALILAVCVVPGGAASLADTTDPALSGDDNLGEVTLPMPCGTGMTFRVIEVPAANSPLGWSWQIGDAPQMHLAAPVDSGSGAGRFLLGKHEVTNRQAALLQPRGAADACNKAEAYNQRPVTGWSWLDAIGFAQRYSAWLDQSREAYPACGEAPRPTPCIPRFAGQPPWLRLPTAAEWEYAARGGSAVAAWEFRRRRPPAPEGLAHYAWSRASADGVAPVGTRKANPLGLHDMLGNVEEWIWEPFRFRLKDASKSLTGGCEVRGGSFLTPPEQLASAARRHVPCYTGNSDIGFRLVASPAVDVLQSGFDAGAERWRSERLAATRALRPRRRGGLEILVDVPGRVSVDGQAAPYGRAEPGVPFVIDDLETGQHFVAILLPNQKPVVKCYSIEADEYTRAQFWIADGIDQPGSIKHCDEPPR